MEEQQKRKIRKIVIIILAVLLALCICALAGTLLYDYFTGKQPTSVIIPENIITTVTDSPKPEATNDAGKMAVALSLYDRNPGDNTPFQVRNMFPGDAETNYYCLQVSYQDTVTLRFHATIRKGYEKLAEVLHCRIALLSTGETLYDGRMRDMPESVNHTLTSLHAVTDELYYKITVYLPTSVGNAYMEKDLIADFQWWIEETENLEPHPPTGDNTNLILYVCLATGALLLLILLSKKRRGEDASYAG